MTIKIEEIQKEDFSLLYDFLKKEEFPYLPTKEEAEKEFKMNDNHIYVGKDNDKIVLFLCFCERNEKLYFDIACDIKYRKKWANKSTMRFIFNTAFNTLNFEDMIVESLNDNARCVVERFGFKNIQGFFYKLNKSSNIVQKYLNTKVRGNK